MDTLHVDLPTYRVTIARGALGDVGAIAAACVPAHARTVPDERHLLAMMSASDVVRSLRCAPPLGCRREPPKTQHPKQQRSGCHDRTAGAGRGPPHRFIAFRAVKNPRTARSS